MTISLKGAKRLVLGRFNSLCNGYALFMVLLLYNRFEKKSNGFYLLFFHRTMKTIIVAGVRAKSTDRKDVHNDILTNCPVKINLSLVVVSLYPKS